MSDEKTPHELAVERAIENVGILGGIQLISSPESFEAIRDAEAKRRGISVAQLDAEMHEQVKAAVEKAAKDRGLTIAELLAALDKDLEFDMRLIERMRACGLEVRGIWHTAMLAGDGKAARGRRSAGGDATAERRKAEQLHFATQAARMFDSLTVPEHNRAALISERMGVHVRTVRRYLKETGRKKTDKR